MFLGEWEGGEFRRREHEGDPALEECKKRHEWGLIPGGETTEALHARVRGALMRIAKAHPDELVAVFVHGGIIGAAIALATGARAFSFNGSANGSISRLVVHDAGLTARGFNDTAHLA